VPTINIGCHLRHQESPPDAPLRTTGGLSRVHERAKPANATTTTNGTITPTGDQTQRRSTELGASASLRRRFEWASSLDGELRKALVAVVAETVAERNRLVHDPTSVPRLALVAAMHGELAD
jgi:hypothetical protein